MRPRYHLSSHRSYDVGRLATFLASARQQRGLEICTLAERACIDANRLVEAETGWQALTHPELTRLAAALSLSDVELLEETGLITHLHSRRHRGSGRNASYPRMQQGD